MKWMDRYTKVPIFALALILGTAGCNQTPVQNSQAQNGQTVPQPQDQGDPAASNVAPVDQAVASSPEPQAAPAPQQRNSARNQQGSRDHQPAQDYSEASYNPSPEQYASQPPPPLPEYEQPPVPESGYLWTPGYWNYASAGYYWVPGAWTAPPYQGALWTPGYWGFGEGRYRFYRGYWGRYVGFYGGVNYGHGYAGRGYQGGYWQGSDFNYNRAANNIGNTRITSVYNRTVINNTTVNRVSYNGGPQGVQARPTPPEVAAFRAPHAPPMTAQVNLAKTAASNRAQFASANNGKPAIFVAAKPIPADKGIAPAPVMRPAANTAARPGGAMPPPQTKPAMATPTAQPKPEMNKPVAKPQAMSRPSAQARPESRPAPGKPAPQAKPAEARSAAHPKKKNELAKQN